MNFAKVCFDCTNIFYSLAYLLLLSNTALGTFWSWALSEPDPVPIALPQVSTNLTDGKTAAASDRPNRGPGTTYHAAATLPCRSDRSCGRGRFCDVLYGRCERLKRRGEFCRKDNNCQRNHECVFGLCRKEIPKGQEGSRCTSDEQCGGNQCCARQHGEFICKPKLKQSMKCFVPAGGLDYSLNEQCPCEMGLVCQYDPVKSPPNPMTKKPRRHDWFQFSSETEQMRCLSVNWPTDEVEEDEEPG